ncbi:alpha/beta fold hydrolase [Marinihelvus fidelis]|nr:alpha/beta fold hydrolase [Marinihelvus fidelis]
MKQVLVELSAYDNDMDRTSIYLLAFLLAGVASWYVIPRRWLWMLSRLGRRVTGFRTRAIRAGETTWRYLDGGTGPDLVLLHGMAGEADHWLGAAGQLRRDFRILIPEMAGFSTAIPPTPEPVGIEAMADRLADWLDSLGIKSCIIGGNSVGGWVAAAFAARHPGRTRGLWLLAPFGTADVPATALGQQMAAGENPFQMDSMADFRTLTRLLFNSAPQVPYPIARATFLNARRLSPITQRVPGEVLGTAPSLQSLTRQIDVPTLVEWGEQDKVMDVTAAGLLAGCLAQADVVTHDECGHMVMLECPTRAASALRRFARKHGWLPA